MSEEYFYSKCIDCGATVCSDVNYESRCDTCYDKWLEENKTEEEREQKERTRYLKCFNDKKKKAEEKERFQKLVEAVKELKRMGKIK